PERGVAVERPPSDLPPSRSRRAHVRSSPALGAAPPDPTCVRLPGGRTAAESLPLAALTSGPLLRWGLRPQTPPASGSLAVARPPSPCRSLRSRQVLSCAGGCAPRPHLRPAPWRSHGRRVPAARCAHVRSSVPKKRL